MDEPGHSSDDIDLPLRGFVVCYSLHSTESTVYTLQSTSYVHEIYERGCLCGTSFSPSGNSLTNPWARILDFTHNWPSLMLSPFCSTSDPRVYDLQWNSNAMNLFISKCMCVLLKFSEDFHFLKKILFDVHIANIHSSIVP